MPQAHRISNIKGINRYTIYNLISLDLITFVIIEWKWTTHLPFIQETNRNTSTMSSQPQHGCSSPSTANITMLSVLWIMIISVFTWHQQFSTFSCESHSSSSVSPNHLRTTSSSNPSKSGETMTVEELMYKYKSDKSRDDHGYTKLYHMIFGPIRHSVLNITEVGIAAGQSIQAWYRYFPNAEIHAFDISWNVTVEENLSFLKDRVKTHIYNVLETFPLWVFYQSPWMWLLKMDHITQILNKLSFSSYSHW